MTSKEKLAAMKRAEKTLADVTIGHPAVCFCDLCSASIMIWRMRREAESPGFMTSPVEAPL